MIKCTRLRETSVCTTCTSRLLFTIAAQKISTFMSGSSVRIILDNFISSFSYYIWEFVNFNVTFTVCRKSEFRGEKIFYFLATFSYLFDWLCILSRHFDHCHQTYRNNGLCQNPTPTTWSSCFDPSNSSPHSLPLWVDLYFWIQLLIFLENIWNKSLFELRTKLWKWTWSSQ